MIKDQIILITGAAGFIGKALVNHAVKEGAKKIIMIDHAETPLYELAQEINFKYNNPSGTKYILGDITHKDKLNKLFQENKPNIVFHAAAYKHVPVVEENPETAVFTNIIGTKNLADLSLLYNVERFIFISTDKALNPSSVMGASKRIAEKYLLALSQKGKKTTKFIINRFGNVLESNGSVIPIFRKQIKSGGPVTVTNEEATRFFMSVNEAVILISESLTIGEGGEIFIFDTGNPIKILDVAEKVIKNEGFKPYQEIAINFTGLRPGEKLHEESMMDKLSIYPTTNSKIKGVNEELIAYEKLNDDVSVLVTYAKALDNQKIVSQMKIIVPEFKSMNSEYESLD